VNAIQTKDGNMNIVRISLLKIVFVATCLVTLSSCESILLGAYGIKEYKALGEAEVLKCATQYAIPAKDVYLLDSSFLGYLKTFESDERHTNHYQPLQALYFNGEGQLVSYQVNCYAGGFPNLKWNRNDNFSVFPPKQQAPLDSMVNLETQMRFLQKLVQTETFLAKDYNYVVVVFWSRVMGRQSKRLIKFVQKNALLAKEQKVKIIYANVDGIFVD
jgi:hypothetical protein